MKRCFIGLRIDEAARAAIAELQAAIGRDVARLARKVRWTRTESLHLTLQFLGATTDGQLEDLVPTLAAVAAAASVPPGTLRGLGAFPSSARPRAVFAAVDGARAEVATLAEAVGAACVPLGFPREERARVPHVTVARVEGARQGSAWAQLIGERGAAPLGGLDTAEVVLFESTMQPGGSVYTPLATFRVGAGA